MKQNTHEAFRAEREMISNDPQDRSPFIFHRTKKLGITGLACALLPIVLAGGLCCISQGDLRGENATTSPGGKESSSLLSGNGALESTSNLIYGTEGGTESVTVLNPNPFMGRLRILEGKKIISIEAKLCPVSAGEKSNWGAIGIGNPTLGTPPWGKGIFLLVSSDGAYGLMGGSDPADVESKSVVPLRNGKIADYKAKDFVSVKLEYDTTAKTVSAWINDAQIVDSLSFAEKKFIVEPAYAGFSGYDQKGGVNTVGNLEIKTKP